MIIIKSDIVPLHGAAISMIGGRPENQDDMAYLDTPLGFLIIVCDGMGGGPGGKTASYIVKHEIAETICECSPQTPRDYALKMAVARAHQALVDKMKENPALSGMGSTFVAALINNHSAVIAHSGDSRFYKLHGKKCLYRTQDHSLVAELVKKKVMTEEDARLSPQANVITRGLGSTNNHVPEIDEIPYKKGDRFILCTDGVWGAMQHQELLKEFTQAKDLQQLLTELSTKVDNIGFSKGGGHDNHTIAMFELENDSQLKDNISLRKWTIITFASMLVISFICCCLWAIINLKEKEDNTNGNNQQPSATVSNDNQDNGHSIEAENTEIKNANKGVDNNSDGTDKNTECKPDTNKVTNGSGSIINDIDTLYNRLSRVSGKGMESDTVTNKKNYQNKAKNAPSLVTTQKIINRYDSAKTIKGKTKEEAQEKLAKKKTEIKELFSSLCEQTKDSKSYQTVQRISNVVDALSSREITKEPDSKSKLYVPNDKAKGLMDKQIKRLKELKEKLEKE